MSVVVFGEVLENFGGSGRGWSLETRLWITMDEGITDANNMRGITSSDNSGSSSWWCKFCLESGTTLIFGNADGESDFSAIHPSYTLVHIYPLRQFCCSSECGNSQREWIRKVASELIATTIILSVYLVIPIMPHSNGQHVDIFQKTDHFHI
jgi:hypothetical protein